MAKGYAFIVVEQRLTESGRRSILSHHDSLAAAIKSARRWTKQGIPCYAIEYWTERGDWRTPGYVPIQPLTNVEE